jgi:hypothetical protein
LDAVKSSEVVMDRNPAQLIIRCGIANYNGGPIVSKQTILYFQCEATLNGETWQSLHREAEAHEEIELWMACEGLATYPRHWLVTKAVVLPICIEFANSGRLLAELPEGCRWQQ